MKVTVLGKDTVSLKQKASVAAIIDHTEEWLRKLDHHRLAAKFKSSRKADRKPVGKKQQSDCDVSKAKHNYTGVILLSVRL